jgi:hypothetical protein
MRPFIIILLIILSCNLTSDGQSDFKVDTTKIITNSNLNPLLKLLNRTKLTKRNSVSSIPRFIISEINCWFLKGGNIDSFTIANPGEPYNKYDMITESLPDRQLIYLGVSKNLILLTYHLGADIAGSHHIMIIKFNSLKIEDFWVGQAAKSKTKKAAIAWLDKHKREHQTSLEI